MGNEAEIVVTGLLFPEGPSWCADGTVVATAVAEGTLYRIWPEEHRKELLATAGGGTNACAPASDGGFLITQNGGIDYTGLGLYENPPAYNPATPGIQRAHPDGTVTYVVDAGFNAPNDLVVAEDGTLYFTDPGVHPPPDPGIGRVFRLAPDGELTVIASGLQYPNGIALEPDGGIVIVDEHGLHRVLPDGTTEVVVAEIGTSGGDGFCIDTEGNFYCATVMEHGVRVFSPDGKQVDQLSIPAPDGGFGLTTNCCFGGADGRTLFATDSIPGQLVAWEGLPHAGRDIYPWPVDG
ncbi:MAG: gluconolactonase [Actinomycetia bacterium]|nr:gluconolactonase [Actinomycetes bacterium]